MILGFRVSNPGDDPYLQKLQNFGRTPVVLAVEHSTPRAHDLNLPGRYGTLVLHAVPVPQIPLQGDGNNFHVVVRVHVKTFAGSNRIIIQHAQGTKLHPPGIIISGKTERMIRFQPPVIKITSCLCFINNKLHILRF